MFDGKLQLTDEYGYDGGRQRGGGWIRRDD